MAASLNPRTVRNFYLAADIDGRESKLEGGPSGKDGGFTMTVYQRDAGNVTAVLELWGHVLADGTLRLDITPKTDVETFPNGNGAELRITTRR